MAPVAASRALHAVAAVVRNLLLVFLLLLLASEHDAGAPIIAETASSPFVGSKQVHETRLARRQETRHPQEGENTALFSKGRSSVHD